ncbi:kinase-like domain-containing protein [Paraphysoderma sedebokerense]|nr:kinase-like domain-containing protein [Paraphysoderma sedebokerense]
MNELPHIPNYKVVAKLGRGGQGEVFSAIELRSGKEVAVKITGHNGYPALRTEYDILTYLNAKITGCSPMLYAAGTTTDVHFIVMEKFSCSLNCLRDRFGPFSMKTMLRLLKKMIYAFSEIHSVGVIHRDPKPANVLINLKSNEIVINDYGLARFAAQFMQTPRKEEYFLGTTVFACQKAHLRREQDFASDLTALIYSAFDLHWDELPWSHFMDSTNPKDPDYHSKIAYLKNTDTIKAFYPDIPVALVSVLRYLDYLPFGAMPSQNLILQLLDDALDEIGEQDSGLFEWEEYDTKDERLALEGIADPDSIQIQLNIQPHMSQDIPLPVEHSHTPSQPILVRPKPRKAVPGVPIDIFRHQISRKRISGETGIPHTLSKPIVPSKSASHEASGQNGSALSPHQPSAPNKVDKTQRISQKSPPLVVQDKPAAHRPSVSQERPVEAMLLKTLMRDIFSNEPISIQPTSEELDRSLDTCLSSASSEEALFLTCATYPIEYSNNVPDSICLRTATYSSNYVTGSNHVITSTESSNYITSCDYLETAAVVFNRNSTSRGIVNVRAFVKDHIRSTKHPLVFVFLSTFGWYIASLIDSNMFAAPWLAVIALVVVKLILGIWIWIYTGSLVKRYIDIQIFSNYQMESDLLGNGIHLALKL